MEEETRKFLSGLKITSEIMSQKLDEILTNYSLDRELELLGLLNVSTYETMKAKGLLEETKIRRTTNA